MYEYRLVQGSRRAMESTAVNQLTSELLCFVQNKMATNDHDFVVKTVSEFYTSNEIIAAKTLLFEACIDTTLRLKTYKVDVAKLNCRDIITKMNEVGANCPVFVAANLAKLPVITADAFNLAKMSKGISSVLNIEQNVHNTLASLACFQNDFQTVLEKCSKIDNIAENLNNLKSAVEKRNARRVIVSDSSASKSDTSTPRQQLTTDDDTDHNDDSDDSNDNDDSSNNDDRSSDTDHNDDNDDGKNDDSVFEHDVIEHSIEALSPHKAEAVQVNPSPVVPVLRLNDRPPHLNAWMTDGGFTLVDTTTQKKTIQSRMFTNSSRKKIDRKTDALKTVVPRYYGNDRRHGGYSRSDNKMCEVFVTRLVPETTASDVLHFVKPRINRNIKIEQLRTKYDEYSSFKLCVPKFLKNKLLDKNFWENDNIYVREFVTKSRV